MTPKPRNAKVPDAVWVIPYPGTAGRCVSEPLKNPAAVRYIREDAGITKLERDVLDAAIQWGTHIGKLDWPEKFGTKKFEARCKLAGIAESRFADAVEILIARRKSSGTGIEAALDKANARRADNKRIDELLGIIAILRGITDRSEFTALAKRWRQKSQDSMICAYELETALGIPHPGEFVARRKSSGKGRK